MSGKKPVPALPPAAKTMFKNLGKATAAAAARPQSMKPIVERMPILPAHASIPVHNSGAGRPNFPSGGGV